jgi:3-hydroxy-9,10-secoandrosta-1,3,5(10)-triene-9,17-dione monooxygenase reductase component
MSPPVGPEQFRAVLSRFAAGVTVVTARSGDEIGGMTVSAFSSVAVEPPLVLVCLTVDRPTTTLITESGWYAVNVLAAGQEGISDRFAYVDAAERFAGVDWEPGPHGLPLLAGTLAQLECRVVDEVAAGDHLVLIGEVVHGAAHDGEPVVYTRGSYRTLEAE